MKLKQCQPTEVLADWPVINERIEMKLLKPKWHETPRYWPIIEGWVDGALQHGGVSLYPRDIYDGLVSRNMKLWLVAEGDDIRACCVTQLVNYQRMRCLNVLVVGGQELDNWHHFYSELEDHAGLLDCDGVEFGGRNGWHKKATEYGFKPVMVIYRKMLSNGQG